MNVKVVFIEGLLSDYVKMNDIDFMIRGVRSHADFDSESEVASPAPISSSP